MGVGRVYIVAIAITDNDVIVFAFQSIHLCHDAPGFVR